VRATGSEKYWKTWMTDHELELRLRRVAHVLDAEAPTVDIALLGSAGRRSIRPALVAIVAVAAFAGVSVAPAAVSALGDLFHVDSVPELGPVTNVAPAYQGRRVSMSEARTTVPFDVRAIPSLGRPAAVYVRDDVMGGMVTLAFEAGQVLLTQWPSADVQARVAVVPTHGTAEQVTFGSRHALWIAGAARGTFTLVGADGQAHRELFDVAAGALLWRAGGLAFLLQGAETKATAAELAAAVRPPPDPAG
jgi:hypothetical protein